MKYSSESSAANIHAPRKEDKTNVVFITYMDIFGVS